MVLNKYSRNVPVLLLGFNRPDTTAEVFAAIRRAQPSRLYFAVDGPRSNNVNDEVSVALVQNIISRIDWSCELKTLFRQRNLGCKAAVSSAISWFFEYENEGIILEDDCVPNDSFFTFCSEALHYFRDDRSVFMVSGDGLISEQLECGSRCPRIPYPSIWGWASWADRWTNYCAEIYDWPLLSGEVLYGMPSRTRRYWRRVFELVHRGEIDTWDYQLAFLMLVENANCVLPPRNMIKNIGIGHANATHTTEDKFIYKKLFQEFGGQYDFECCSHLNEQAKSLAEIQHFSIDPLPLRAYKKIHKYFSR